MGDEPGYAGIYFPERRFGVTSPICGNFAPVEDAAAGRNTFLVPDLPETANPAILKELVVLPQRLGLSSHTEITLPSLVGDRTAIHSVP